MYWYITYSWRDSCGVRWIDHDTHTGYIDDWIIDATKQPEAYRLLNAIKVDKATFDTLVEQIG